ncbi:STAS domain-containing protein [Thalassobacillus pellis]|uniref:STAS domain-containing protein n=1 Tax=Thalassobacillus pellis TaxID=748008 RepID=UPI0019614C87|nr:STAS domain-containing protein [Thalassobacillus pellis]MBM7553637.1 rsbT co-antagonist protein RsbR [Thalassobacillus pellis]
MEKDKALKSYIIDHAQQLTNEWYETLEEKDPSSLYASRDPQVIETLKKQNFDFHHYFSEIFVVENEEAWLENFNKWVSEVSGDIEHLSTPSHYVIREFMRVRMQYMDCIKNFYDKHKDKLEQEDLDRWNKLVVRGFDVAIMKFVEGANENSKLQLKAKEEIIHELSAPVITLDNQRALLPLIGEIDSDRASVILENTLHQCSQKGVTHLFIDLSGVATIDTLVAHQISNLLQSLQLLGISSTISGMRPEIAHTATQLGISFEKVTIKPSLANAL